MKASGGSILAFATSQQGGITGGGFFADRYRGEVAESDKTAEKTRARQRWKKAQRSVKAVNKMSKMMKLFKVCVCGGSEGGRC